MNSGRFWRAALIQLIVVAIPFAILALTVSEDFFEDYGYAVGPAVWLVCSLVTGRILRLPLLFSLFCAAAGGVAAVLVMLVAGHEIGLVAGIAVFAASASGYERPGKRTEGGEPAAQSSIP
ncbi:MAG TPA: hypothetical protein VJT75_10870 [Thermoleophilaceae bacterium]|nr:hypothetical protein [Thermoleophilaceae bacterium]